MTMFYVHPASPFQRTTAQDAQIQAWRNSTRLFLGKGITIGGQKPLFVAQK
jgi:hypothetical protein